MLDAELLALLVCPETRRDVALATPGEIALINEAIKQGLIHTVGGKIVDQPVQGALIRDDRAVAYPIKGGIPVMLVDRRQACLLISGLKLNPEGKD